MITPRMLRLAVPGILVAAMLPLTSLELDAQTPSAFRIEIVQPTQGSTLFIEAGRVSLSAQLRPGIAGGEQLEWLVDGTPAAAPQESSSIEVSGLRPGRHTVQARIVDAAGNVASTSPAVGFYLLNASALSPIWHRM